MFNKTLFFNLLWRIALLIATSLAIHFMVLKMLNREAVFTLIVGITLLLVQIYFLSAYVMRINKTLIDFIDTVGQSSASELQFHERNPGLPSLEARLNQLMSELSRSRFEEQKQKSLLDHVIDTMETGIICLNQMEEVVFSNKAARSILQDKSFSGMDELEKISPQLAEALKTSTPGTSRVIPLPRYKASVSCNDFRIDQQQYSLYSIHNIQQEVDAQEVESWQKLIRVLTHEIMNSLGPILSLSKSLKNKVDQPGKMISGLSTIENTGEGLIHFIGEYRKLSTLPDPRKSSFRVAGLFGQMEALFAEECNKDQVQFEIHPGDSLLDLYADQHQVELVMINLIRNALESLKTQPHPVLELWASEASGRLRIEVRDNGPGIPDEIREQIFVPFYSTRTKGSGIGLSLSRQIMNKHEGSIHFTSIPGKETVFCLDFPGKIGLQ